MFFIEHNPRYGGTTRFKQELLAFTQGLDFGRYIRDAEVQSMIDQVKKRIAEIERQPEVDDRAVGADGDGDRGSSGGDEDPMDEAEVRLEVSTQALYNYLQWNARKLKYPMIRYTTSTCGPMPRWE